MSPEDNNLLLQTVQKYLTRDNITLAIAIFGALGNIANWIVNYCRSRRNITIQINRICHFGNTIVAYVTIQNESRLPISINNISAKIDGNLYNGFHVPQRTIKITRQTGDTITATREHSSMSFPLNLGCLSGVSGYLCFDFSKEACEILSTLLTFQVSTNRGKPFETKSLLAEWTDWEKMF